MKPRTFPAVLRLAFVLTACADPRPTIAASKPAPSAEPLKEMVVHISIGGQHAGSGTILTKDGYIVTDLHMMGRSFPDVKELIINGTIKAKMIEIDSKHGLALIKAEAVFRTAAALCGYVKTCRVPADAGLFSLTECALENECHVAVSKDVRVVGYSDIISEPPMVEKRVLAASALTLKYRGESVTALDLSNICLVGNFENWREDIDERGAAVFMRQNGKLLGISIGKKRSGELMVMPSEIIKALLERHTAVP